MKVRKKLIALLLTAAMSLSFTACGSENDSSNTAQGGSSGNAAEEQGSQDGSSGQSAAEILASSKKNMAEIKSLNAQSVVEMDMKISADGEEQSMESVTTMDMSCSYDPVLAKIDMTMDMGELGTQETSMYMEETDGEYKLYVSDGTSWQSQAIPAPTAAQYDAASNMTTYMDESLEEAGTEKLDSGNAYKYTGVITGDRMKEVMDSSGMLDSLSSYGIDADQADSLLSGLGEISVTLWIDEETLYPVKYELDETEIMNTLMAKAMESAGGETEGVTMEFSKVVMQMTCSDFNEVEAISIPDEAKGA